VEFVVPLMLALAAEAVPGTRIVTVARMATRTDQRLT
jgi:hypothetical protein